MISRAERELQDLDQVFKALAHRTRRHVLVVLQARGGEITAGKIAERFAGVKPGVTYGKTDDFSYNIVENPVHIRDLNATILHQLGIDHNRLSFPYQGLDQRLTGVEPSRVEPCHS